jgi:basic membrane protein A
MRSATEQRPAAAWSRRRWLAASGSLGAALAGACASPKIPVLEHGPFAAVLLGDVQPGSTNARIVEAFSREEARRGAPVHLALARNTEPQALAATLRDLAGSEARMVFGVGGALAAPMQQVAWEFPEQHFTLLDGELVRPNMAAYRLREEEPAWLAGLLAARLSATGRIGLMLPVTGGSGAPVSLESAFQGGAAHAKTSAQVHVVRDADPVRGVRTLAAVQADIVYAALNEAPDAALAACAALGLRLIGHSRDWSHLGPGTVIASCLSDPGALLSAAVQDISDSVWHGDVVHRFGMRYPQMVGFALDIALPEALSLEIRDAALEVQSGRIDLAERAG